jgi:hypothetical protein
MRTYHPEHTDILCRKSFYPYEYIDNVPTPRSSLLTFILFLVWFVRKPRSSLLIAHIIISMICA